MKVTGARPYGGCGVASAGAAGSMALPKCAAVKLCRRGCVPLPNLGDASIVTNTNSLIPSSLLWMVVV